MPSSSEQETSGAIAVRVTGVTKRYHSVDSGPTRNLALNNVILLARQVFGVTSHADEFEALKDVSFSVPRGTTLGIIGGNGSGKSTLLKLIARVTPPSDGTLEIDGRIVSLLELGFGFRDDLTGRENVLMSGVLYDIPRSVVRDRLDAIIAFAGIERFIDMPIRTYSSGMYLRLAFATAIHMDPDIILADEVLAVGDIRFRSKCLNRLMEMKAEGKTLLYVSHDVSEIRRVSDKVLWLRDGRVQAFGDTEEILESYLSDMQPEEFEPLPVVTWEEGGSDSCPLIIESALLTTRKSTRVQVLEYHRAYYFQIRIRVLEAGIKFFPRIDVASETHTVGRFAPLDAKEVGAPGTIQATLRLPRFLFNAGRYEAKISVEVLRSDRRQLVSLDEPIRFSVVTPYDADLPHLLAERTEGPVHPLFLTSRSEWEIGDNPKALAAPEAAEAESNSNDEAGSGLQVGLQDKRQ